jgi:hypothetical protein
LQAVESLAANFQKCLHLPKKRTVLAEKIIS